MRILAFTRLCLRRDLMLYRRGSISRNELCSALCRVIRVRRLARLSPVTSDPLSSRRIAHALTALGRIPAVARELAAA